MLNSDIHPKQIWIHEYGFGRPKVQISATKQKYSQFAHLSLELCNCSLHNSAALIEDVVTLVD